MKGLPDNPDVPYMPPRVSERPTPIDTPPSIPNVERGSLTGIPARVWQECEKIIGADSRLQQRRTVVRASFAIGQAVQLAVDFARGTRKPSPGLYHMPDYEAGNAQIPISGSPYSPGGGESGGGSGGGTERPPGGPGTTYFDNMGHEIPASEAIPGQAPPCRHIGPPANALDIVEAVRSRYPSYLGASSPRRMDFLRELARSLGPQAGLLDQAPSGYAPDVIAFQSGEYYDVVDDASTSAQWSYLGRYSPSRWRAP